MEMEISASGMIWQSRQLTEEVKVAGLGDRWIMRVKGKGGIKDDIALEKQVQCSLKIMNLLLGMLSCRNQIGTRIYGLKFKFYL